MNFRTSDILFVSHRISWFFGYPHYSQCVSQQRRIATVGRNLVIYVSGVALAVAGALGIAEAIELSLPLAVVLFAVGLAAVLFVHEYLDGPF